MSLTLIRATDLTLLVAGPGAHHAFAAAEFGTAAHRRVFRPAEMILDGPAEAAARVLGVDRDRRAALAHVADQLAGAAGALLHRRSAGLGDVVEIEAVAIGAANADREGAGRFSGA